MRQMSRTSSRTSGEAESILIPVEYGPPDRIGVVVKAVGRKLGNPVEFGERSVPVIGS